MSNQAETHARLARSWVAERFPWFAPALFGCHIRLTYEVAVAAISEQMHIFFNPTAVEDITAGRSEREWLPELGFLWLHEVSHILREHADRARDCEAASDLWNLAADLEINDSNWPGLFMPEVYPGYTPKKLGLPQGQIAEYYYQHLIQKSKPNCEMPDEGSGAHGAPRPWEQSDKPTSDKPTLGMDKFSIEQIRVQVAEAVRQAARQNTGSISASWQRWAEDKLSAKVNWRKVLERRLRRMVAGAANRKVNYTYQRPHRRQTYFHPLLPPSLHGDLTARIACVVDTSGSMRDVEIGQSIAEVMAILATLQMPVTVIPCDIQAFEPVVVSAQRHKMGLLQLPGGGWTDMRVGIAAALAQDPRPDIIVVLTDGYTLYPEALLPVPVIFGLFAYMGCTPPPRPPMPPWGEEWVVEIGVG